MSKLFLALGAALALSVAACSNPAQTIQVQQAACQMDAAVQPIAASVVSSLVPAGQPIVAADTLLVHPAVVAYCKSLGGAAVVVTDAVPAAVPAPVSK